jgi:hypothetical protein
MSQVFLARWLLIKETYSFLSFFIILISSRSTIGDEKYPEKCQETTSNEFPYTLGCGLLEVTI